MKGTYYLLDATRREYIGPFHKRRHAREERQKRGNAVQWSNMDIIDTDNEEQMKLLMYAITDGYTEGRRFT